MIPVSIADVIQEPDGDHHVLVLMDETKQRLLPNWVGAYEGWAVAMGIDGYTPPVPWPTPL